MARKSKICQMCIENTPELAKNYCERCQHKKMLDNLIDIFNRYKDKNIGKVLEKDRNYHELNRDKILSRQKQYHINNRDKRLKQMKKYREINKEKILVYDCERKRAKKAEAQNAQIQADNKISQT